LRILCRELGRGDRVAVRHGTGQRYGHEQQPSGQPGRRCEDDKNAGAEHGSEPDGCCVGHTQSSLQLLVLGHGGAGTFQTGKLGRDRFRNDRL
jgi:hypothetical protein